MDRSLESVAEVMRAGVLSVTGRTSLAAAARVMREHGVHGVLVVGDEHELLGWVTARGLLRHSAEDWRRLPAADAISEPCVAVVPSASIRDAIDAMTGADASHLAVVRPGGGAPEGVIADIDVVAHLSG